MRRSTSKITGFLRVISKESSKAFGNSQFYSTIQNAQHGCTKMSAAAIAAAFTHGGMFRSRVVESFASSGVEDLGRQRRHFATEPSEWSGIIYPESELRVGESAPEFTAEAVIDGEIKNISLSDYRGKYVILFWYPKDFTFVCPTEIIAFSDRAKEFEDLNCQLIAASTDTPEVHLAWCKTPRKRGGLGFMQIPLVADVTKGIAAQYGVLKEDLGIALRGLYIINPEGVVEHATINNFPIGRSVDEAMRTLQAIQYVAEHGEVCPAGWKPGDKTMVADPEKSLEYFQEQEEAGEDETELAGSEFKQIDDEKHFQNAIQKGKSVVKFWAPWCGKCRQLKPYADEVAATYNDLQYIAADTTNEKLEELVDRLGVKGLPAFRFYKDGEEVMSPVIGYKKQPFLEAVEAFQKL